MSGDPPVSLVAKIRKLLAKAEGTDNPNEAEAFSAKAAQLIAAHRIDPGHVAEALASGELGLRRIVIGRGAYVRARLALLAAVAGNHDCEVVFETGPHGTTATIAGYQSDLDVTEVLYTSLHAQAANQMAAVRRRTPAATQRWRRSFLFGFARRVAELLAAAREDARDAERRRARRPRGVRTPCPTCWRVPGEVREFAARSFGRVVAARAPAPAHAVGWHDGQRAAVHSRSRSRAPRRPPGPDEGTAMIDCGQGRRRGRRGARLRRHRARRADRPSYRRGAARRSDGRAWWRRCGPAVTVARPASRHAIVERRGVRDRVEIKLTDGQLSVATVAHELAHALAGVEHGHDDEFRAAYVDVVAVLAGAAQAVALSEAFAAMGIAAGGRRWPPPHRVAGDGFVVVSA